MTKLPQYISILFILTWLFSNNAHGQKIDHASLEDEELQQQIDSFTSSSFEMILYPTLENFTTITKDIVQSTIKNSLLLSSSITTGFNSLDSIEVSIQRVEFKDRYCGTSATNPVFAIGNTVNSTSIVQASLVEFEVKMYFDDVQDTTSSLSSSTSSSPVPTQFAMDNLIVKTFSQPSTKSSFVEYLSLTGDPLLIEIEDIVINLVEDFSNDDDGKTTADVNNNASRQLLSTIDIVLIIASSFIVIGIICIFVIHNKKQDDFQHIRHKNSSNNEKRILDIDTPTGMCTKYKTSTNTTNNNNDKNSFDDELFAGENSLNSMDESQVPSLGRMIPVEGNIIEAGSLESSIDSQAQMVLSAIEVGSIDSSIDSQSLVVVSTVESPVMSYASTSSSSSSGSSTTSASSSSSDSACTSSSEEKSGTSRGISTCKEEESTVSSNTLGTEQGRCDETTVSIPIPSHLSTRLSSFFDAESCDSTDKDNVAYSTASAPTILENNIRRSKNESKSDGKSINSARSASSESLELDSTRSTTVEMAEELLNGSIMTASAEEFRTSWLESKRKALDDIEEGSIEDVFRVDVDVDVEQKISLEENRTIRNGMTKPATSVSEWMKSVRVVSSASEILSSVEHSSIEPKSSHGKENNSIDLSLEDSLATSLVEV